MQQRPYLQFEENIENTMPVKPVDFFALLPAGYQPSDAGIRLESAGAVGTAGQTACNAVSINGCS